MKTQIMVIDVESVGLHGCGFAVGWVLMELDGAYVDEGLLAVNPLSFDDYDLDAMKWVRQNVPLKYKDFNCYTLEELHKRFWNIWMLLKDHTILAADCPWPVESNFLTACVNRFLPDSEWKGPYPILDICSFRLAMCEPAMVTESRYVNELPAHNPLNDARQSARQLRPHLPNYRLAEL